MSYEPDTFYISVVNKRFIRDRVEDAKDSGKKRYNKSMWLDDVLDSLRAKNPSKTKANKSTAKRFAPPTVDEVFTYCNERCNNVDAQTFVDHYLANGWMRGKVKIKDWKACVRTWEKGSKQGAKQFSDVTNQNITNVGEWLDE